MSVTRRSAVTACLVLLSACGAADDGAPDGDADTAAARSDSTRAEAPRLVAYTVDGRPDGPAVERVLRAPDRLASELKDDSLGVVFTFEAAIRSDGRVQRITFRPGPAGTGYRPAVRTTLLFEGEVAVRETPEGDSVRADTLAVPEGTLPWLPESVALLEQVVLRARSPEGDSVVVPLLHLGVVEDGVAEGVVVWDTPSSATLRVGSDEEIRLSLEADGRVSRMENLHRGITASRRR